MKRIWSNKYVLIVNAISIMVAFLTHFPELITLSNPYSADGLSFPGMHWADVGNEVLFTYLSLLFLFFLNEAVFRFNSDMVSIGWKKVVCSFVLTWVVSNLLGKCFVYLHQHFDVPAIDAMLHHYLHPLRDFLITCIVTGSCYFFHQNRKSRKMLLENQQLRMENVINQYEALKSQLNPHFLFNTLNNIYSLIAINQDKAQYAVHDLSRMLRHVLYENNQHFVSVDKEFEFMKSYIELMSLRLPKSTRLEVSIPERGNRAMIAPLLFIPLIENAFKHGVSSTQESFINIKLELQENNRLNCLVENSNYPKKDNDRSGSGIGLTNLKRRLELLYPGKYIFKAETLNNRFITELLIQL